jgi:hypothetical protein
MGGVVDDGGRVPFGAAVEPCGTQTSQPVAGFLLGVYRAALHVRWVPPPQLGIDPIGALAVDNEPSVFWGEYRDVIGSLRCTAPRPDRGGS